MRWIIGKYRYWKKKRHQREETRNSALISWSLEGCFKSDPKGLLNSRARRTLLLVLGSRLHGLSFQQGMPCLEEDSFAFFQMREKSSILTDSPLGCILCVIVDLQIARL